MKKLIVLPGNSVRNKEWGDGIAEFYGGEFDDVYVQYYDHWQSGEEVIDFEREAEKLRDFVSNEKDKEFEYYIFAKSFGSILTFLSIDKGFVNPTKCVFFGIPLNLVIDQNIFHGDWSPVSEYKIPTIAFHNDNDPTALVDVTRNKLEELHVDSIHLAIVPGANHSYTEFNIYKSDIENFLK